MEIQRIPLAKIERNTGQIEGVPTNPRQWTEDDVERISRSLEETPELFEARPLILYPVGNKFVTLGGNLRFTGASRLKWKTAPAIILPEETRVEKLKEIVIKDNGSFGDWDFDSLANEWDDLPLEDWGVPSWGLNPVDEDAVNDLFTEEGQTDPKDPRIAVIVPLAYEDKLEDIKASLRLTLEEWTGCKVQ